MSNADNLAAQIWRDFERISRDLHRDDYREAIEILQSNCEMALMARDLHRDDYREAIEILQSNCEMALMALDEEDRADG